MESKADTSDLEKLCGVIESKVDLAKMHDAVEKKIQQHQQTTQSFVDMISKKADSREIDRLSSQFVEAQKSSEERFMAIEDEL